MITQRACVRSCGLYTNITMSCPDPVPIRIEYWLCSRGLHEQNTHCLLMLRHRLDTRETIIFFFRGGLFSNIFIWVNTTNFVFQNRIRTQKLPSLIRLQFQANAKECCDDAFRIPHHLASCTTGFSRKKNPGWMVKILVVTLNPKLVGYMWHHLPVLMLSFVLR